MGLACFSRVCAGDGFGVALALIVGIEEPLLALLELYPFFVQLAVEGYCTPPELFGYLGGGVGACGGEHGVVVLYFGGLLLDYGFLGAVFLFEEEFLCFGLLQAAVEDFHCVGYGGIVVAGSGYARGEELLNLCIYPHCEIGR